VVSLFEEFLPAATNRLVLGGGPGVADIGFLDSALDLLGDIVDPFFPGGAGSETRATAFGGDVAKINVARKRAGLPALPGTTRRRRRKALTNDDIKLALTIASAISKKAAENFILTRTRGA